MAIQGKLSPDVAGVATVFCIHRPRTPPHCHWSRGNPKDKRSTHTLAGISLSLIAALDSWAPPSASGIADRGRWSFVAPDRPPLSVSACPQLRDRVRRGLRFL